VSRLLLCCALVAWGLLSPAAQASTTNVAPVVFAIGANGQATFGVTPLRYADDDAVEAAALYAGARDVYLHATLDDDSQRRFPSAASRAKPATVTALQASVDDAMDAGHVDNATVVVWISGHGIRDPDGHPSLLLDDGPLSAAALHAVLLQPLAQRAHRLFVVVDTCFAGGLVRSRAQIATARKEEVDAAFARWAVPSAPNVAVVFGASAQQQSFEWSAIGAGVFSAMLRAGLRGAADVNDDGDVRLDELVAFGRAAGAEVRHRLARPTLRVVPAPLERNLTVMRRAWHGRDAVLPLQVLPHAGAQVEVRTDTGRWLASVSLEDGFGPQLFVPRDATVLLKAGSSWFRVDTQGDACTLLPLAPPGFAAKDASADAALRQGLFRAAFGPAFFGGFEAAGGLAAAQWSTSPSTGEDTFPLVSTSAFAVGGGAALVAVGSAALAGHAWVQWAGTDLQVPARDALQRATVWTAAAGCALVVAAGAVVVGAAWWPMAGDVDTSSERPPTTTQDVGAPLTFQRRPRKVAVELRE